MTESAIKPAPGLYAAGWRTWMLFAVGAAMLYVLTLAPGVVWQDGGELQTRCLLGQWRDVHALARAHVLYIAGVRALGLLPGNNVAWEANLFTALMAAVTVANLGWFTIAWTRSRIAGVAATVCFAVSHAFWQFATMAEVYTLFTALLSAELCCLLRFRDEGRARWVLLIAAGNGLGFANHNLALLSGVCYLAIAVLHVRRWRRPRWPLPIYTAAVWTVGASPLLLLVLMDWKQSGGLTTTLSSLLVGRYGSNWFTADVFRMLGALLLAFPTPLLLAAPVGIRASRRRRGDTVWWTLVMLLAVHALFVVQYGIPDVYAFLIPTELLLAVFIAPGVAAMLPRTPSGRTDGAAPHDSVHSRRGRSLAGLALALAAMPVAIYAVLPTVARRVADHRPRLVPLPTRAVPHRDPYRWFLQPWHTADDGAERFAVETLRALPPDAWLMTDSTLAGPLMYVQNARRLRLDVRLNYWAWYQPWRDRVADVHDELRRQVARGRVYCTADHAPYVPRWLVERFDVLPREPLYSTARVYTVVPKTSAD